jgi:integrase/recombinase XerD
MLPKFEQFIRERQYIQGVTPATVHWYRQSFRLLPNEDPTDAELKDFIIAMRARGCKPSGCNCRARAVNAYLKWAGSPHRIPRMKEPQFILPTFTAPQVSAFIKFKPYTFYDRRLHLLVLMLLDTGARIGEALGVRVADCDLDNLLVTLDGKGQKQRRVPFSFELRRHLYRFSSKHTHPLLFSTAEGCALDRHVVYRDVRLLCKRLGFEPPRRTLHACRHTFALNYVRKGGSVFHLQKVLGHTSLEMTRRYVSLAVEDIQAVHERISLIA